MSQDVIDCISNEVQDRVLARSLSRELTHEELNLVSGAHDPTDGSTCTNGTDCDPLF